MENNLIIPPDVRSYLIAAAVEVAARQNFIPAGTEELREWMGANRAAVGARAKEMQDELLAKFLKNQNAVTSAVSASVYRKIRQAKVAG